VSLAHRGDRHWSIADAACVVISRATNPNAPLMALATINI
jgi:hypothetical protein